MALIIPKREEAKKSNLIIPSRYNIVKPKTESPKTKISTLPDFLSGGSYNTVIGEPNTLLKTERGYAGVTSSSETERHHIIPVEFGGDSTMDKNILALGEKAHQKITNEEAVISKDYKDGKISLPQARQKTLALLQKEQDEAKGVTTSVGKNLLNIVKENIKGLVSAGVTAEKNILKGAYEKVSSKVENVLTKTGVLGAKKQVTLREYEKSPEGILAKAQKIEKRKETEAKIITAPIRFTAGSLASGVTSYALEKADSDGKYTPKTDAEKLLINTVDVQRLTKQEDLYGIIARGSSVPVALLAMAVIENPFIKNTGVGVLIREGLERKIKSKVLSKLGTEEIIKIADDAIKAENKAGKITEKEAIKISEGIDGLKVKETIPASIVEPQKTTKLSTAKEITKTDPKNFKTAEDYVKAQESKLYIHGTQKEIKGSLELKSKALGVQQPESNAVDVIYLTPNTETGITHSRMYTKQNGFTYAIKLKPEAKIFDYTNPAHRKMIDATMTDTQKRLVKDNLVDGQLSWMATPPVKNVKKLGFDGMKQIERKKGESAYSATFGDTKYKEHAESLMLFNKNVFEQVDIAKTKSQLISEWNKANKEIPLLPKKQPIKYVPEEKQVDLRTKVTTERLIAESSVPNRIKDETISKGLKADFGAIEDYNKVSFEDQAKLVGEIIDRNPEDAINIALGRSLPKNGALPESVFVAVKNQAIKKGDTELLVRLATEEGGVAKESTVLGQRIKMLDESLEDDAFKNINDVVKGRKKTFEAKGGDVVKAKKLEVNKIKEAIKKSAPKVDEWKAFIQEIKCK